LRYPSGDGGGDYLQLNAIYDDRGPRGAFRVRKRRAWSLYGHRVRRQTKTGALYRYRGCPDGSEYRRPVGPWPQTASSSTKRETIARSLTSHSGINANAQTEPPVGILLAA